MGKGRKAKPPKASKKGPKEPKESKPNRKAKGGKGKGNRGGDFVPHDDADFGRKLGALGLRVKEVEGDGNCLFRSIADQVYGGDGRHAEVRDRVADYLLAHEEHFKWFVEDDEDFGDYVDKMSRDGEWGGHQELYAASQLLGVDIVVHQHDAPALKLTTDGGGEDAEARPTLHLSYHGEHHYNSAVPLSGPQPTHGDAVRARGAERTAAAERGGRDEDETDANYEGDDEEKLTTLLEHFPDATEAAAIRALNACGDDVGAAADRIFALANGVESNPSPSPNPTPKNPSPNPNPSTNPNPDPDTPPAWAFTQRQGRKIKLLRRKVERAYDKKVRERMRRQRRAGGGGAEDSDGEASADEAANSMAQVLNI